MTDDDIIQLFRLIEDAEDQVARLRLGNPQLERFDVRKIFDGGAMPSTVPAWYDSHPVTISGTETEGSAATITTDTTKALPLLVLGPVPSVGDNLPARLIGGLWVAGGGATAGGGTAHCGSCTGTFSNTFYLTLPGLGLTSAPLPFTGVTWSACFDVAVLGYAACNSVPTGKSTVTHGFRATVRCPGAYPGLPLLGWTLEIDYLVATGGFTDGASAGNDAHSRAPDIACPDFGFSCSNVAFTFSDVTALADTTSSCTRPVNLTFGPFTISIPGSGLTVDNNYVGTTATVKDTP